MTQTAAGASPEATATGQLKGRWGGLGALSVAGIIDSFEGGLLNTLFPAIQKSLGLPLSALGVLTAISRFARMAFGPIWALVADRVGRKRILFLATGLWGLWTLAAGFAQNFTQLFVLYAIGAIGTVASEPITNGLITDLFETEERGRAFGILRTLSMIGIMLGTPLVGRLGDFADGWRWGLFLMGGLSVASGILILIFVKEPPKRTTVASQEATTAIRWADIKDIFASPTIRFMAFQVILTTSLVAGAFFNTFFVQVRGWSVGGAAILLTAMIGGAVVSGLVGGFLGDWFEKKLGPKGRVLLMQGYLAVYAVFAFLIFQIDWGTGVVAYIVMFANGLVGSIGHPGCVLPIVGSVLSPRAAATTYALLFSLIQGGFSAIFSLAFGFLAESLGLEAMMFWLITVPYAVNAVAWTVMYRIYPPEVKRARERNVAILGHEPGKTAAD